MQRAGKNIMLSTSYRVRGEKVYEIILVKESEMEKEVAKLADRLKQTPGVQGKIDISVTEAPL